MNPFYTKADLVCVPVAYKTSVLYSEKPTTGTGNLAFVGDGTTRYDETGTTELMNANVPRLDYTSAPLPCARVLLNNSFNEQLSLTSLPTALSDTWTIYFEVERTALDTATGDLIKFIITDVLESDEVRVFNTTNGRMRIKLTDDSANFDNLYTDNDDWNQNEKLKVAIRSTGTEVRFYAAGVLKDTSTGIGSISIDQLEYIKNTGFHGLRIYTTTLTDAECKELTA
jgi:hypothetical protein